MNNRTLEIILKLKDELTKKMVGVEGALRQFSANMKSFARDLNKMGVEFKHIGSFLIGFGATLTGPLALAFNASAKYSRRVSDEMEHAKTVSAAFQLSLANALVPVMSTINNLLGRAYKAWMDLGEAKQRTIVQAVFLTGVFATLAGVIFRVLGSVMTTAKSIISLVMKLNPVSIAVMAIVAAVILLIEHWDKVRNVVIPILNGIEVASNMVAIGFHKVISGMVDGIITLSVHTAGFLRQMAQIPGPQQNVFLNTAASLDTLASKMRGASVAEHQTIEDLQANIEKIFVYGSGKLGNMADDVKMRWEELKRSFSAGGGVNFDALKAQLETAEANAKLWSGTMTTVTQQTAQAMTNSMGTLFFDAFSGKLGSLKDYMADFGTQIMQILAQALAKMLLVKTIGAAFPGMAAFFHQGGVVRAHSGYLTSDEVPIIAQAGEGIISRRGMATLGASNLQRLNSGGNVGGGSRGHTFVVNIAANDARSFRDMLSQHPDVMESAIMTAVTRNKSIRHVLRNSI